MLADFLSLLEEQCCQLVIFSLPCNARILLKAGCFFHLLAHGGEFRVHGGIDLLQTDFPLFKFAKCKAALHNPVVRLRVVGLKLRDLLGIPESLRIVLEHHVGCCSVVEDCWGWVVRPAEADGSGVGFDCCTISEFLKMTIALFLQFFDFLQVF